MTKVGPISKSLDFHEKRPERHDQRELIPYPGLDLEGGHLVTTRTREEDNTEHRDEEMTTVSLEPLDPSKLKDLSSSVTWEKKKILVFFFF